MAKLNKDLFFQDLDDLSDFEIESTSLDQLEDLENAIIYIDELLQCLIAQGHKFPTITNFIEAWNAIDYAERLQFNSKIDGN
jgi:hypothetical protein